jgi:L-lactate dehydrogenase
MCNISFNLVTQGICDEVLMININKEKALGKVLDLKHCIEYLNKNVNVKVDLMKNVKM